MSDQALQRRYRFSIVRVLFCGVLLTVLSAVCLYVFYTAFDFCRDRFLEEESKTLAWFTLQLSLSLPFIVICLFHYIVYHKHDRHDGVARREMFWEVVVVTALLYAVLLPYLSSVSDALHTNMLAAGESVPTNEAGSEVTLLMELHDWFIRLTIPLGALMVFHAARARREIRFPEEEEPLLTVAEYELRKAAARESAARESAACESACISPEEPTEMAAEMAADGAADEKEDAHE